MLTVGVDVGGTRIRGGVVDPRGGVLDTVAERTPDESRALESAIGRIVAELTARYPVRAVGVALAGFVSRDRSVVRFAPHLPWRDADVTARLARSIPLPLLIEHDGNAAAFAEQCFGAGADEGVTVYIALGTGIGAALLIDGQLYRGAHGVAPELGHLRVVPGGRACPCGKRGCWERYCSGTALAATFAEMLGPDDPRARATITGLDVAGAARDGDPVARRATAELASWLGAGLALVADVFDPDLVIIGGGLASSAPLFLNQAREHYLRMLTGGRFRPRARVAAARLGEEGGIIGAAELARRHLAPNQA